MNIGCSMTHAGIRNQVKPLNSGPAITTTGVNVCTH